jgi:two-component system chemotaxis response regulator CheB
MPKLRILVVDDAMVMRKLMTESLRRDPDLDVAGVAANGKIALQMIPLVNPDLVTLDLEMPEMDGLATLREIRKRHPLLPVIIFSTISRTGANATLDALALGANDYVTKPANVGCAADALDRLEKELIPQIKIHCRRFLPRAANTLRAAWPAQSLRRPIPSRLAPVQIVCLGTSTGGPNALAEVFGELPGDLPVPVVVVQHMPPMFTAMLAKRLDDRSSWHCHEGEDGQLLERGHAYLAPGGRHMEVVRSAAGVCLRLHDGPTENSCRPAVDVLFRSVAAVFNHAVLGVVMTGMGQDGTRGSEIICAHGGQIIAQDEASSVVWGMPGCVVQRGIAEKVLPLNQIASEIARQVRASWLTQK